jgi:hypothetical protein
MPNNDSIRQDRFDGPATDFHSFLDTNDLERLTGPEQGVAIPCRDNDRHQREGRGQGKRPCLRSGAARSRKQRARKDRSEGAGRRHRKPWLRAGVRSLRQARSESCRVHRRLAPG